MEYIEKNINTVIRMAQSAKMHGHKISIRNLGKRGWEVIVGKL